MNRFFDNYIRRSYALAILIIALFSITTGYWIWSNGFNQLEQASREVTAAGKQRALTERLRGLGGLLIHAESPRFIAQLRGELKATIDEYVQVHDQLIGEPGALPDTLEVLYFREPEALDRQLKDYVGHARALLALPDSKLGHGNPEAKWLEDNRATLFVGLDKVVRQYRLQQEQATRQLQNLALWVTASVVLLLVIIVIFIFWPMEKRILKERRGLRAANQDLDSVLQQERLQRQQLSTLYQLAEQMLWIRSQVKLMQNTSDFLFNTLSVHCAAIFEFQQDSRLLLLRAATGMPDAIIDVDTITAGPGSKGAMMLGTNQPIYSEDLQGDGWLDDLTCERDTRATQCVVVPIHGQEQPFGVILVMSGPSYHFGTEELNYIKSLGDLLGVACDSIISNQHMYSMQQDILKGTRISALGELGTSLAHELNQPLVAIMNYANACRRLMQSPSAGEAVEGQSLNTGMLIEKLVCEAERAGNIIKHMRDYLETGELHESELDLNRVVRDSVELAKTEAISAGVTIDCALEPALPNAKADKIQLQQVLFNLLRNAVIATQDGASQRVTVSSRRHGEKMIEVIVADTGSGKYGNAFNGSGYVPFSAKQDEMGVGLSVCRSIIEAHGGQIWATRAIPPMTNTSAVHFTLFRE